MLPQLLVLSLALLSVSVSAQVLELTPGKVLGFDYKTKKGDYVEVYLNIPYAAAPVGELRFERPKPPDRWDDIRDCRKFGPVCHPIVPEAVHKGVNASEDCLTLNIIRPKKQAPPAGFPILFWVHGGAWEIGSAREVGYEGLAEIYAANDIVVVTIQYRLSVYGFFSTGDERIPGNMGLFDMAQALKVLFTLYTISSLFQFINANADNIGGDPSSITVWGHSAGSASVTMLILSPVTRDYIRSSIEMSGAPWASWTLGTKVANDSLELAEVLGCSKDIKECMKTKTVEEIYEGIEKVVSISTAAGINNNTWYTNIQLRNSNVILSHLYPYADEKLVDIEYKF
ncbi:Carboxylesterase [Oesophagostomum dentatum]|uniref:Carboxylesterase n=1 Tax=Oesophagostomum dentatum TaxID=61180 RepID=A0A0B1SVL8_OESDE|nr:Carboxylesterase [Oesophagostomum dentatum]